MPTSSLTSSNAYNNSDYRQSSSPDPQTPSCQSCNNSNYPDSHTIPSESGSNYSGQSCRPILRTLAGEPCVNDYGQSCSPTIQPLGGEPCMKNYNHCQSGGPILQTLAGEPCVNEYCQSSSPTIQPLVGEPCMNSYNDCQSCSPILQTLAGDRCVNDYCQYTCSPVLETLGTVTDCCGRPTQQERIQQWVASVPVPGYACTRQYGVNDCGPLQEENGFITCSSSDNWKPMSATSYMQQAPICGTVNAENWQATQRIPTSCGIQCPYCGGNEKPLYRTTRSCEACEIYDGKDLTDGDFNFNNAQGPASDYMQYPDTQLPQDCCYDPEQMSLLSFASTQDDRPTYGDCTYDMWSMGSSTAPCSTCNSATTVRDTGSTNCMTCNGTGYSRFRYNVWIIIQAVFLRVCSSLSLPSRITTPSLIYM